MNDILFWIDAIRHRRRTVWTTFALVLLAVLAYLVLSEPKYSAEARLLFDRDPPELTGPDRDINITPEGAAAIQQTRADVIHSQSVAKSVARRLRLAEREDFKKMWRDETDGKLAFEPWVVGWLRDTTSVDAPRASNTAVIYAKAPTPELAAAIANGVADAFINKQLELKTEPARANARWLTARTGEARDQLRAAEAELSGFKRANQLTNGADLSPEVDRLQELSTQLAVAEASAVDLAARAGLGGAASSDVQQTPVIQSVRESIAEKAAELSRIGTRYGRDHPTFKQAKSEVANLRASLSRETATAARSLRISRVAAEARRSGLNALVGQQRERMIKMSSNLSRLALLQSDNDRAQRNYDQLSQRLSQTQLQSAVPTTDVRLLDPATAPLNRSSPGLGMSLALGTLLGIVLGAVVAIICEYLDPRVRSLAGLQRTTRARVVGVVPAAPDAPSTRFAAA